jgi:hypothetical protein
MHPGPCVRLRTPEGRSFTLAPGGLIGRAPTAACRIEDPRVSEAHAMLSLRGRELRLLALRGELRVDGLLEDDLSLSEGLEVELAEGLGVLVEELSLPERVMGLRIGGRAVCELSAPIHSLVEQPSLELLPRFVEDAPLQVWSTSEGWSLRLAGQPAQRLRPGRSWRLGTLEILAVELSLDQVSALSTQDRSQGYAPMRLVLRTTSVHVHREGRNVAIVTGLSASVLCELAEMAVPAPWETVARQLWRDDPDRYTLRNRWDRVLRRLRRSLDQAGIREDLVRVDGHGNIELVLLPRDELSDET